MFYFKRVDVPTLMSGILGSLVSITAICAVARPGESIFIGFIGSMISVLGWLLLEKLKIDDPVGAIIFQPMPALPYGACWLLACSSSKTAWRISQRHTGSSKGAI